MPISGPTDFTDDLRLAHVLADDADSLSMSRFKALDLHVMSKPDLSPVTDADQAVEEGIRRTLSRARSRDAVLGEEQGSIGPQPAAVDHRPDRRHQELRPRSAGVGHPDRARRRRRGRRRRRLRTGAAAPLVGVEGRRRVDRSLAAARPRGARSPTYAPSRTPPCPTARCPAGTSASACTTSSRSRAAAGAPAPTATSGPTCCSPRAPSTWPPSPSSSSTTWPRSTSSCARRAAASPPSTGPTGPTAATRSPRNGHLHDAALAFLGSMPHDDTDPDSRPSGAGSVHDLRVAAGPRRPISRRDSTAALVGPLSPSDASD